MIDPLYVAGRAIGHEQPVFVVAEIGLNHNGDAGIAEELVRAAAAAGADAVKFQKRDMPSLLTSEQRRRPYDPWYSYGATYGEHREALELSAAELRRLRDVATEVGVVFFVSAWDLPSVEVCEELDVPMYKVASADVTNTPLLERVAATGKPVLLSTGMSAESEVSEAVATVRRTHDRLALLHCVSTYPADFDEINLATIPWLRKMYGCPVGYSGHELGIAISAAAVALGACIIERHVTLDRTLKGPDHAASLEPPGLWRLVRDVRAIERGLGTRKTGVLERERPVRAKLAKSLVAARPLPAGHCLTPGDLVAKSPGEGLQPSRLSGLLGRRLARELRVEEQIATADLVEEPSIPSRR